MPAPHIGLDRQLQLAENCGLYEQPVINKCSDNHEMTWPAGIVSVPVDRKNEIDSQDDQRESAFDNDDLVHDELQTKSLDDDQDTSPFQIYPDQCLPTLQPFIIHYVSGGLEW